MGLVVEWASAESETADWAVVSVLVQALVLQALVLLGSEIEELGVLVLMSAMVGAADLDRCQQPTLLPTPTRRQHQRKHTAASNTTVS
jgi:hypothetical protein